MTLLHLNSAPQFTVGFTLVAPHFTWQAVIGIAVPLWLVTMASQNVPGVAVLPAAAGLALVGTLAGSIQQALDDARGRLPAAVTFLVAASGITVLGIGGAFWALVVGVLLRLILVRHRATA